MLTTLRLTVGVLVLVCGLSVAAEGQSAADIAALRVRADAGDADAQSSLGLMCAIGRGVPKDYTQSVSWYRKAAEQGNALAQYNLGANYEFGDGVPQDFVSAHLYYNLAASRSVGVDQKTFAVFRDRVAAKMTPQQIADAQKRASEWVAAFEKRGGNYGVSVP